MEKLLEHPLAAVSKTDLQGARLREQFYAQGYIVQKGFLPEREIAAIARDMCWLVEAQLKALGAAPQEYGDPVRQFSRNLIALHQLKPEAQAWIYDEVNRRPFMYKLAASERLLTLARELLSERVGVHPRLNMIMSMPQDQWHLAVWHQDGFYGPHHLNVYIPLQRSNHLNGGIMVAPGAHKSGVLPHGRGHNWGIDSKFVTISPEKVAQFPEKLQLELEAGDLLLFHRFLPHTAHVNQSDDVRFALTLRYTDLTDPFFLERGWQWKDIMKEGLDALASKRETEAA